MEAVVEVVVDGVEEGVSSDFRGSAGGVVDVVVFEGYHVVGAGEVKAPVMSSIASRGVIGATVNV